MPSRASSDPKARAKPSASSAVPRRGRRWCERFLISSTAIGACSASLRAQPSAASNSSWSGTTWLAKPDPVRLERVDRIAGQVHLERLRLPHEPRQPLRAAESGNEAQVDLGLAEGCRLGRDAEVAGHRQLAASAEGDRVDGRDRDRRGPLHPRMKRCAPCTSSAPSASGLIFVNSLMSAPRAEGEDVRRGEHEHPDLALDRLPQIDQVAHRLRRERVGRRPVEPGDRDVVARLEQHGLALFPGIGPRIAEEALAGLLAEPPLGHQAAQDRGRLERLAPFALGALELLQHRVEARPRRRV